VDVSSVIKLGGSLLDLPELPGRLANFLADFARPRPIVVCGGGPTVDLIRAWDRLYAIGEEESHWIAVQALTLNALVLERVVPRLEHVQSPRDFRRVWNAEKTPLYDAYRFLKDLDEPSPDPLPRRWRVTSDSIAARMATLLGASELVLLKSIALPGGTTIESAVEEGVVDPHFAVAAMALPRVVTVDFRDPNVPETVLVTEGIDRA
jgi:aspartokinase-like uncharacterized kinase